MSRRAKLWVGGLVLAGGIGWFGRDVWLLAAGRYLTVTNTNEELRTTADAVVVPAADYIRSDVRIETLEEAARLRIEGCTRRVVMTCPQFYGVSECELAERALLERGYIEAPIESLRTERVPDDVEAEKAIRYLKDSGAKSAIILLPNYKVRRLGGVYRRLGARFGIGVEVRGRAGVFDPARWWRSPEGQKRFAEEFVRRARLL